MATVSLVRIGELGASVGSNLPLVVGAASAGTLLSWYDFYLYTVLASFFGAQFFPTDDARLVVLASLGLVWTGFALRPLGAIVFGHLGDRIGRKFTLTLTLALTGGASLVIGLLPGYDTLGLAAPLLLVAMRIIQGLALGGEYGSAATYVAEYAPDDRRGLYTSWLQITATLGIVLALLVVLACRVGLGDTAFAAWGWRVPFWISAALVLLSLYIRLKLDESPLFVRLKDQGRTAANPARESFSGSRNWRLMLLALFGATAPEGVVWYTGQFYALYYLTSVLKVPYVTVYILMMVVLTLAAPFFVLFGALSDRIGRRNIMAVGFALAAVSYWPVFSAMAAVKDKPLLLGILVLYLVVLVTMVYGPIAAFLVELFPARIRCTSLSVSYHVGNGVFGGLVPLVGAAIATTLGGPLYGLAYPIGIAALGVVVSLAKLPARSDETRIWREVGGGPPRLPDQP